VARQRVRGGEERRSTWVMVRVPLPPRRPEGGGVAGTAQSPPPPPPV
jgi:hypothetical protein